MGVHGPTDWSIFHTPAVATQPVATKAAVTAQKHVCTSISATIAAVAAQGLIQLNLRDGITGVGTIIWSKQVALPVGGVWEVNLTDLSIPGSIGNAMTLELSGAPAATNYGSVALTGYDSA